MTDDSKTILKSDEWKKAVEYEITDEDIDRARSLIGFDEPSRNMEYNQTATIDNIRNFAHGAGNDNPLFCDPEYAKGTRWGSMIAPGMMAGILNAPMKSDPTPDWVKTKRKSLFKGIHVFVSGSTWDWYRPIYPGDTLYSYRGIESIEEKQSEFSGRSVIEVLRDVKINQRGEVVAVYRILRVFAERKTAVKKGKYKDIQPATYTDEDIAKIDEVYAAEVVRGAEKRNFDSVDVGDSLGVMAKGPLTVTDVMCFHSGGYGFVPYRPAVGRIAYKNRQRIPAFFIKNEYGVPDVAQRLHWDPLWAQAIGNPMAYDYGVMRENYLYHYLTDWAGDDGIVIHLNDQVRKFNYMGDTQMITGEVTGKRQENDMNLVDVTARMTNQRGEETLKATATIALPLNGKPVLFPDVPRDLAAQAAGMMERHWQLLKQG